MVFNYKKSNYKDKIDFLNSINYLTEEDINNEKTTLEKISRLHPSLNEYNPLLYSIYLQSRKDLENDEIMYYQEVIRRLMENEKKLVDSVLNNLRDSTDL